MHTVSMLDGSLFDKLVRFVLSCSYATGTNVAAGTHGPDTERKPQPIWRDTGAYVNAKSFIGAK